jgi:farnesyl-diphosphate farnesyltransferase
VIYQDLLKGVSRSFYLSLRFLPKKVRNTMCLAFLFCKAADTIADTRALPEKERLNLLKEFRKGFPNDDPFFHHSIQEDLIKDGASPAEQSLLTELKGINEAFRELPSVDQNLIQALVTELTQGMIIDLEYFTDDALKALETDEDLDNYTYLVAGCVGVFWTRVLKAHFRFAQDWNQDQQETLGNRFGRGLQMVNVLRDLPRDLAMGRCYLPADKLKVFDLSPEDLIRSESLEKARPYLNILIDKARDLLRAGSDYARGLPDYCLRLRWVVLLPMHLGYRTLDLLEKSDDWLDPTVTHKVARKQVYRSMARSLLATPFP